MDDRLPRITMVDFTRYLDAKGANLPCSRCGTFEWTLFTDPESQEHASMASMTAIDGKGAMQIGKFYPFLVYYCRNCSNSYSHVWHIVADWISKNPASKDGA